MKHTLLLITLLWIAPAVSFAQRTPEKIQFESNCPVLDYCKECGDKKATFPGKLKRHFEKELNFRDLDLIDGVIIIQVAIDTTGRACAYKFHNFTTNTSEEINRLQLDRIIHRMPRWHAAILNGVKINSRVLLALYSKVEDYPIFHIDYLRNDKNKRWVVNSKNPVIMNYNGILD